MLGEQQLQQEEQEMPGGQEDQGGEIIREQEIKAIDSDANVSGGVGGGRGRGLEEEGKHEEQEGSVHDFNYQMCAKQKQKECGKLSIYQFFICPIQ